MNKVILVGRLTKEPEVKSYGDGKDKKSFVRFSLAVDRGYQEKTDFIPCVAFGKTAEFISKYITKGTKVIVDGQLNIDTKRDNEGKYTSFTSVNITSVEFAESKAKEDKAENPFV